MNETDAPHDTTETPMRPPLDLRSILGYLALLVTLLLAGPGVRVVRADDAAESPVSEAGDGPMCSAQQPLDERKVAAALEAVRQQAPAANPADAQAPIALSNRGYNYGPSPEAALDEIREQLGAVLRER
jgi:hypothetical protein